MSRLSRVCAATGFLLLLACAPAAAQSAERLATAGEPRGVLMINAYNLGYDWTDELIRGLRTGLDLHGGPPTDLWIEFLDTRRRGNSLFAQIRSLIAANYTEDKVRVIVAADDAALQFLVDYAPDLLRRTPVVFCGVSNEALIARAPRERVTGVREVLGSSPFLDLAFSLHSPRRLFIVSDASLTSATLRESFEAFAKGQPRTQTVVLDGRHMTLDAILATLREQTTNEDLVVSTAFTTDESGRFYPPRETIGRIATAATAPVYSPMVSAVGQGLLASGVNGGFEHGLATARLTLAVLAGRAPDTIPIESFSRVAYQFDYEQLVRRHIDPAQLPSGAIVVGRPRSFYTENRLLIWGTSLFIVGQMLVIAALGWNVLQRRRVERHLARAEEDLRQSQKMDAIGRLAGGIAHDFNNLLTVINGYCELLLDPAEIGGMPASKNAVQEIRRAGEQAATLTSQLLAFSRKQLLQVSLVDLNRVIADLESMLGRLIGERIALVTELSPSPCCISVDASQIQQVVVNLVVNARDAMPDGGRIVLSTSVEDAPPRTAAGDAMPAGRYVTLSVADSGTGMSVETQAQIFEPFFTTKAQGKGTGLGLATVYGIVRQSGGWIDVDSEVGLGTTFTLYFPWSASRAPEPAPPIARAIGAVERDTAFVVVVEDQPEVRSLAVTALTQAGYDVREATDGDEALARFGPMAASIDLLITDVVMPGLNGRELANRLREVNPDLLVVFLSGYADAELDRQAIVEAGGAFLPKPFTPSALVAQAGGLLRARRRERPPIDA